jgi:Diacylglycerol kinase catalytic domain
VVELPREKPERALELFADMPGLRLLIIGGDGTVGWVLSCLDALQVTATGSGPGSQFLWSVLVLVGDCDCFL